MGFTKHMCFKFFIEYILSISISEYSQQQGGRWTENKRILNFFYSIFAKKRNSQGHVKCIKKQRIIPRSCCLSAIMLLSHKTVLLFSMILNGEAAYCPGSQLVPIFHLPLNGVPKLAAVFKLLKTAASFKNGLSYL